MKLIHAFFLFILALVAPNIIWVDFLFASDSWRGVMSGLPAIPITLVIAFFVIKSLDGRPPE